MPRRSESAEGDKVGERQGVARKESRRGSVFDSVADQIPLAGGKHRQTRTKGELTMEKVYIFGTEAIAEAFKMTAYHFGH